MKIHHAISAMFTSALLSATPALAINQYNLKDLGIATLDPFALNDAIQINDQGLIAGYQGGHAMILDSNNDRTSPLPGTGQSYLSFAKSILNSNKVVGISEVPTTPNPNNIYADPVRHAALWNNENFKDLGTLGGTTSAAYSINSKDMIVGISNIEDDTAIHATLWSKGTIIDLGTLGGDSSDAININANDLIVGDAQTTSGNFHATMWSNGNVTDLGTLGGNSSFAYSINSFGQIVGSATTTSDNNHATLWENGEIVDLGSFSGNNSSANSINDHGEVVGNSDGFEQSINIDESAHISKIDFYTHAILWKNKQAYDLNNLINKADGDVNLIPKLVDAYSINANGLILTHGYLPSLYSYNREGEIYIYAYEYHSFLLTPVPEPESYALMLAGLGIISIASKPRNIPVD